MISWGIRVDARIRGPSYRLSWQDGGVKAKLVCSVAFCGKVMSVKLVFVGCGVVESGSSGEFLANFVHSWVEW